jgi:hypothetical protein
MRKARQVVVGNMLGRKSTNARKEVFCLESFERKLRALEIKQLDTSGR